MASRPSTCFQIFVEKDLKNCAQVPEHLMEGLEVFFVLQTRSSQGQIAVSCRFSVQTFNTLNSLEMGLRSCLCDLLFAATCFHRDLLLSRPTFNGSLTVARATSIETHFWETCFNELSVGITGDTGGPFTFISLYSSIFACFSPFLTF